MNRAKGTIITKTWKGWKSFMALTLFIFLMTACGGETSTNPTVSEADRETITSAIESFEFFDIDITDDKTDGAVYDAGDIEVQGSEPLYSLEEAAELPVAWGRGKIKLLQKDINISIAGNKASVAVTDYVSGSLFVDTTDDGEKNAWENPFEDTLTRYAEFTRILNGWRLTKISPLDISLTDTNQQTVQIQWIRASVDGETVWEITSSTDLFDVPEELPTFLPQTEVLVEAKVINSTSSGYEPDSFVFLHHPGGFLGRARDLMFDDGTNSDQTASDGVFSRTYTIGQLSGRYFAAVDVIDSATLMDESAVYNSTAWGMPYIVVPPSY